MKRQFNVAAAGAALAAILVLCLSAWAQQKDTQPATQPGTRPARPAKVESPKFDAQRLAAAYPDPPDTLMGIYEGTFTPPEGPPAKADACVFPEGDGMYRAALSVPPAKDAPPTLRLELTGKAEGGKIALSGKDKEGVEWSGELADGKIVVAGKAAKAGKGGKFELARVVRKSPTEGQKPPPGAVVLLPSTDGEPSLDAWANSTWTALPGGVMQVGKGDNKTRQAFGDVKLHLEFMVPYEPKGRGQGRGNSGVYLQDRYEIQVLDSFGLIPRNNECGAMYSVAAPKVTAALPPLSWQTYDVEFRAPRPAAGGRPAEKAGITVLWNGVKVHENQEIGGPTTAAGASGTPPTGPLKLQDHGHPVRYRNIWIVELKDQPAQPDRKTP